MPHDQENQRIERCIVKRTNRQTHFVSYVVRLMQNGRASSRTFSTLPEARAWRDGTKASAVINDRMESLIRHSKARESSAALPLAAVIDWYRSHILLFNASSTVASDQRRLDKLLRHKISQVQVPQIAGEDILAFLDDIKQGRVAPPASVQTPTAKALSDSSTYKYFSLLNTIFKHALAKRVISCSNPCAQVDSEMLTKRILRDWKARSRDRRLQEDELSRLFAAISVGAHASEMLLFVALAVEIPTRRAELLDALKSQVDLHASPPCIHSRRKGHGPMQRIFLTESAVQLVKEVLTENPIEPKLFPSLSRTRLRHAWEAACKRANIVDLRVHDLRHEATSALAELGLGLKQIMLFTGHKTYESLMRYINVRDQAELIHSVNQKKRARKIATGA